MNPPRYKQRVELAFKLASVVATYTRNGAFPAEGELNKLRIWGEEWIRIEQEMQAEEDRKTALGWCVEEAVRAGEESAKASGLINSNPFPREDYRWIHWRNGFESFDAEAVKEGMSELHRIEMMRLINGRAA
jgi:hypothetical protein